jgi:hypothetical protein
MLPTSATPSDEKAFSPRGVLDDIPSYQSYVSPLDRVSPHQKSPQTAISTSGSSKLDAYYRDYDSYKYKRLSGHQRKYSDLSPSEDARDSKERESQKDHLSYKLDKLEGRLRERERERDQDRGQHRRYSDISTTRSSTEFTSTNKENALAAGV